MLSTPVAAAGIGTLERMADDRTATELELQLASLYAERQLLFGEFGTADSRTLIALVRSLEAQLASLYAERAALLQTAEARTHHAPQTKE